MINEVIRLVSSNQIKETEENKVLFGAFKYPTSMIEAWQQFKKEIWQKSTN